jgi:hypothetical protein
MSCTIWEEDMLDDNLRRLWEEEANEARDKKELKREIKIKNK